MGSDTMVQLGIDPAMKQRLDFLNKELEQIGKSLAQILPVIDAFKQKIAKGVKMTPDALKNIKSMSEAASNLLKQREEFSTELDEIKESLLSECAAQVVIKDTVYAGTRIMINDIQMTLKSDFRYCRFVKDHGDIKMMSL